MYPLVFEVRSKTTKSTENYNQSGHDYRTRPSGGGGDHHAPRLAVHLG